MPPYFAEGGSWTIAMPNSAFTARSPSVPSAPVPERMMQIACSRWSAASERKKQSIGRCGERLPG